MSRKRSNANSVGINDADYITAAQGNKARCPYYVKWLGMFSRCYSEKFQSKNQSYKGCTVCEDWHLFSNFRAWMIEQDWEGKHLDKDLLVYGNKVYSPETCCFISARINSFIHEKSSNGLLPGVYSNHKSNRMKKRFRVRVSNPFTLKSLTICYIDDEVAGHILWLRKKLYFANLLADVDELSDNLRNALISRYEVLLNDYNYKFVPSDPLEEDEKVTMVS